MVYKKYIKRGNKIYGPYLYKSIKKDGKVTTHYLGHHRDHSNIYHHKKNVFSFIPLPSRKVIITSGLLTLLVLVVLLSLFFITKLDLVGRVTLDIKDNYLPGENIQGEINLILKAGELFPADTTFIVDNSGEVKEFNLKDLVLESVNEGNFYVEGLNLSENGSGYGILGQKEVFPLVTFSFIVIDEGEIVKIPEKVINESNESIVNETIEEPVNETTEEQPSDEGAIEEPSEEVAEEGTEEQPIEEGITQEPGQEEIVEEQPEEAVEEINEQPSEEQASEPISESPSESGGESVGITGEVIDENIIEGIVIKDSPYEYSLEEGKTIQIIESSQDIFFEMKDGKAIITTDYSEIEEGFGEEYLTDEKISIPITLDNLGIVAKEGELTFKFVYNELELLSASKTINVEKALNETNITEISIVSNITTNESNLTTTIQFSAVLNQPVKWKKIIQSPDNEEIRVKIPKSAEVKDIRVTKEDKAKEKDEKIDENVGAVTNETVNETIVNETINNESSEIVIEEQETESNESNNDSSLGITGNIVSDSLSVQESIIEAEEFKEVILDGQELEYEIEYETPAPYAVEEEYEGGKRIKVIGPSDVHYENVLAFTNLPETLNILLPSKVKIKWVEEGKIILPTIVEDKDNNGIYDYVEWIVPTLSNQTFEIILITKAEHLDENRTFISDIYEEVKVLDNVWSETIPENHFVRVTFEVPLDNTRDITLWPRTVNGTPKIEVYGENGTEVVAEFGSLNSNEYNRVILTGLNGSQDTFDLKIFDGDIEIDHIIDPVAQPGGAIELRAQACNQENDQATKGTFDLACDTTYPGACGAGSNAVSCNDNINETFSSSASSNWGGINVTYFNSSITDCGSITQVFLCYEWWASATSIQNCDISVDVNGGASYTEVTTSCPGITSNPGVICNNATSLETWACSNFFGTSGTRALAKAHGQKSSGSGSRTFTLDVLFFNVTYALKGVLNVSIQNPIDGLAVAQNNIFAINATVNCLQGDCGIVTGTPRYNASGTTPNTEINLTSGDVPLYVVSPTKLTYIKQSDGFSVDSQGALKSGVTTDGTDFFVIDSGLTTKILVFNSLGVNYRNITIPTTNNMQGIVTNGTDFWVTSDANDFVYHFDKNGNNITDGFSTASAGADTPRGITTNGSDFWITDTTDDFVYHFSKTGVNITDGFSTASAGAGSPTGITTNGTDFWVSDQSDNFVYHFSKTGVNITDGFSVLGVQAISAITSELVFPRDLPGKNPTNFWIIGGPLSSIEFLYHYKGSFSCGNLNQNDNCMLSWIVNATGALGSAYEIDVNFNSSNSNVASNDTLDRTVSISSGGQQSSIVNITLISPPNNSQIFSSNVDFLCNTTGFMGLHRDTGLTSPSGDPDNVEVSLWGNWTGSWHRNSTIGKTGIAYLHGSAASTGGTGPASNAIDNSSNPGIDRHITTGGSGFEEWNVTLDKNYTVTTIRIGWWDWIGAQNGNDVYLQYWNYTYNGWYNITNISYDDFAFSQTLWFYYNLTDYASVSFVNTDKFRIAKYTGTGSMQLADFDPRSNITENYFTVKGINQNVRSRWNCQIVNSTGASYFAQSDYLFGGCGFSSGNDWNITSSCILENQIVTLAQDKDLNILNAGSLTVINSTIRANQTANGNSWIRIWPGGKINITQNSLIDSVNSFKYSFIADNNANFLMTSSRLEDAGWADSIGQRGLEINTTINNFKNNTLKYNYISLTIYSSNSLIENNSFEDNGYIGLNLRPGNSINLTNVTFKGNVLRNNTDYGIQIFGSDTTDVGNLSIINNTITSSKDCIFISQSANNTITYNYCSNTSRGGIRISAGFSASKIKDNNISFNTIYKTNKSSANVGAIYQSSPFQTSLINNIFDNNIINTNNYGFRFVGVPSGNNITNSKLSNNTFDYYGDGSDTFINTTFNGSALSLVGTGRLTIKYWLDINVSNGTYTPLQNANVSVYNWSDHLVFWELTGFGGIIKTKDIIDYIQFASSQAVWRNYTLKVNVSGYPNYSETLVMDTNVLRNIILDGSPTIGFVAPTPNEGGEAPLSGVIINVSVNDSTTPTNLTSFIDWNRTLVGWWTFNEGSGQTVYDLSSYKNNGTLGVSNNLTKEDPSWFTGYYGSALSFDGVDDYVSIPYTSSLAFDNNDPITISAWIKPEDLQNFGGDSRIVNQGDEIVLRFVTNTNEVEWILNGFTTNDRINSGTNSVVPGTWSHVVGVYNTTDLIIYVNGIQKASIKPAGTYGGITSDWRFSIPQANVVTYNGSLDDIMIFNRALSQGEIFALYNQTAGAYYKNFTNLTAGNYTYKAYAQDVFGYINNTETRNLTVGAAPIVQFVNPSTDIGYYFRNFTYANISVTDSNTDTIITSLFNKTDLVNKTNSSKGQSHYFTNFTNLPDSIYYLNASANDTLGNLGFTETRWMVLDSNPPFTFFVPPTPPDGYETSRSWEEIKVRFIDNLPVIMVFNWNTTNFTLYDNSSLLLMLNFDNRTELGEDADTFEDASIFERNVYCVENSTYSCPSGISSGKYGKAYNFSDYYDNVIVEPSANIPSSWTLEAWFMTPLSSNGAGSWNTLFRSELSDHQVVVRRSDMHLGAYSGGFIDSGFDINTLPNGWHHIAVVGNTNREAFYIDGIWRGNTTGFPSTQSVRYVGNTPDGSQPWGVVDEVRIWNRSLSAQEINEHYLSNLNKEDPENDGFIDWYFYVNQSNLSNGNYTYFAYIEDIVGGSYMTDSDTPRDLIVFNCGTLTESKTLINNHESQGTCFTIGANDVTLDCNNKKIIYGKTMTDSFGIENRGYSGTTIKNCVIEKGNSSTISSFAIFIHDNSTSKNTIFNNTITTTADIDEGIYFSYSSGDNLVYNNNIIVYGQLLEGIFFQHSGINNSIYNNTIIAINSSSTGLRFSNISYSRIYSNNITKMSDAGQGIILGLNSSNNNIYNNNITTTSSLSTYGINLGSNSRNNTFTNNIISTIGDAIRLNGASGALSDNLFANNTLTNLSPISINSQTNSYNNTFLNNTLNRSRITFSGSDPRNLTLQWYARVNVTNETGSPLNDAIVNISDVNGLQKFLENTSQGLTNYTVVTDAYFFPSSMTSFNNHTVVVSKPTYITNFSSINITSSMTINIVLSRGQPWVRYAVLNSFSNYTNETLTCAFNVTHEGLSNLDVSVLWFRDSSIVLNQSIINYSVGTNYTSNLSYEYTKHDKTFYCNVSVTDIYGQSNWSNSSSVKILNYTSSLNITNSTNTKVGEIALFTANYSSGRIGDIGRIIWNKTIPTSDVDAIGALRFFDYDLDGRKDEIVTGNDSHWFALDSNGNQLWSVSAFDSKSAIRVANMDNDSEIEIVGLGWNAGVIIINRTGGVERSFSTGITFAYDLEVGDINHDGINDIVIAGENTEFEAFNSTGTQLWTNTPTSQFHVDPVLIDMNNDGFIEYIAVTTLNSAGNLILYNATNGNKIWNISVSRGPQNALSSPVGDFNRDGSKDLVTGEGGGGPANPFVQTWDINGNGIWNSTIGDESYSSFLYEIVVSDLNNDGFDDVVAPRVDKIIAVNNSNNTLWIFNKLDSEAVRNLLAEDINDDVNEEIVAVTGSSGVFDSNSTYLYSLNGQGGLIFGYNISKGPIGAYYGNSEAMDISDINGDGVNDIALISYLGDFRIFQDVNCSINFNDSVSGNMTWDTQTKKWLYNRIFSSSGTYSYNVTCEKGGYETKINSGILNIAPNDPPQIKTLTLTPSPLYTGDDANCTFNVTDAQSSNLNVSVKWYNNNINIKNESVINYPQGTNYSVILPYTFTHYNNNINCSINATDGVFYNASSVSQIVQNYSTNLNIFNETNKLVNETILFTANYSSGKIGNIGRIIWNTSDFDNTNNNWALKFFDYDNDGRKDEIVSVNRSDVVAFDEYGNNLWRYSSFGDKRGIRIGDVDNDTQEEIIIVGGGPTLVVLSKTGQLKFQLDASTVTTVEVGDLNYDGINDIIVGGFNGIMRAVNGSGTILWSKVLPDSSTHDIELIDMNDDGFIDYVAAGSIYLFNATNGSIIWNFSLSSGLRVLASGDFNLDGNKDIAYGLVTIYNVSNNATLWQNIIPGGREYELVNSDVNGDGFDDLISGSTSVVRAINNTGNTIWDFNKPFAIATTSMSVKDINDDIEEEIIFGDGGDAPVPASSGNLRILRKTDGIQLLYHNISLGSIGASTGNSEAIDISDINKDGVNDIAVSSSFGYVHIFQDVNCRIFFNDSVQGNMTWNETTKIWNYNRNFSSIGTYSYNVTCSKGAYETKLLSSSVNITQNTPPFVGFVPPTPANDTRTSNKSVIINVSVNDTETPGNLSSFIDWNRSLIGWWRFNETTGQYVNDTSSWGNNGTLGANSGSASDDPTWISNGKFGYGLTFDGVNDWVSVPDSSSLDSATGPGQPRSWGYWIKFISGNISQACNCTLITDKSSWFDGRNFWSELFNNSVIRGGVTSADPYLSTGIIAQDTWHHIMFTYNGTHVRLYHNGVLVDGPDSSVAPVDNDFIMRIGGTSLSYHFNGSLDDIMIFSRALSQGEILALYNQTAGAYYNNFTNLVPGNYTYKAYVQDLWGLINSTEERTLEIKSECGTITQDTTLVSNVSSNGTCFTIGANNIKLDCSGYSITYGINASNNVYGVYDSTWDNITIKNCVIIDGNASTTGTIDIYAINDVYNINVYGNTIYGYSNFSSLVEFDNTAYNNSVYNNTIYSLGLEWSPGILLDTGNYNNRVYDNVIYTKGRQSSAGVYMEDPDNHDNLVYNNKINTTWSAQGSIVVGSMAYNNSIYNNTIYTNSSGINIQGGASYNWVYNNYIDNYVDTFNWQWGGNGVSIDSTFSTPSHNNTVYRNTIRTDGQWGLGIMIDDAKNNTISYNIITTYGESGRGIHIDNGTGHYIHSNNITTYNWSNSNGDGIRLIYYSQDNIIANNTINTHTDAIELDGTTGIVNNNTFANNTITNQSVDHIQSDNSAYNNYFLNNSFNKSKIIFSGSNADRNLTVQWFVRVNVTNSSGYPIANVTINLSDVNGLTKLFENTTNEGLTNWTVVTDAHFFPSSMTSFNNHTVNATKSPFKSVVVSENITYSKEIHIIFAENSLPTVVLVSPANNETTTNRTPQFVWDGNDAEGDSMIFDLNITCIVCSADNRYVTGLAAENYTPPNYLKYLYDNGFYYNWSVRVSDDNGVTWSSWTAPWRLNIQALISINLINRTVDFGNMIAFDIDNTTDNNPYPFVIENNGTVRINVSMNASDLFYNYPNPTSFFQFKISESAETGSLDLARSAVNWRTLPTYSSPEIVIVSFNWSDVRDTAEIDLLVEIPIDEPPGTKNSLITFLGSLDE